MNEYRGGGGGGKGGNRYILRFRCKTIYIFPAKDADIHLTWKYYVILSYPVGQTVDGVVAYFLARDEI